MGANGLTGGRYSGTTLAAISSCGVSASALARVGFGQLPRERWDDAFLLGAGLLAVGIACWLLVDRRKSVAAGRTDRPRGRE